MKVENNYIFLEKEAEPRKTTAEVNEKGTKVLNLNLPVGLRQIINKSFDIKSGEWQKIAKIFRYKASKQINIDGNTATVLFEIFDVQERRYLNIVVESKTKAQCIKVMEYIDSVLCNPANKFEERFIMINAYDSVSEYYCNRIFAKFAHFERTFRRLLFNIYVLNYGNEYFSKTIDKEIVNKAKGNIRAKKNRNEKYLKEFFYSLDYSDLQAILFKPSWTSVDEADKEDFLIKNSDLSALPDDKLRKFINGIGAKSDWDRLFKDKVKVDNIEGQIDFVRKFRNQVAHSKFFMQSDYKESTKSLNKLLKLIENAIALTQDEDFHSKNMERFQESMHNISKTFEQFYKKISTTMAPIGELQTHIAETIKPYSEAMEIIKDFMKPYFKAIGQFAINPNEIDIGNDEKEEIYNSDSGDTEDGNNT